MIDYHMHTPLCKHAQGRVEEYVEGAIKKGIKEIAFTDHGPLPDNFDIAHRMSLQEMEIYYKWISKSQNTYKNDITILFGIEMDYYRGFEKFTEQFLNDHDFDLVIMSVHFLKHWPEGNWVFNYNLGSKSLKDIYSDYLDTIIEGVNLSLFNVVGHVDIVKKRGSSLINLIPNKVETLLKSIKDHDMALEINTSGYRKEIVDTYPGLDWLPLIKKHSIPLCVGSDAHHPDQVGLNFKHVYQQLETAGLKKIVRFRKRKKLFEHKGNKS